MIAFDKDFKISKIDVFNTVQLAVFLHTNMNVSENIIHQIIEESEEFRKPNQSIPLYRKVYQIIRKTILNGELHNNCQLPATRILAKKLNLSRSTLVRVYDLLRLEGLLSSKLGSGHIISFRNIAQMENTEEDLKEEPILSSLGKSFSENTKLVNSIDDKFIAFRPGLPPLDVFPVTQWRKQANKYWQFIKSSELSYYAEMGVEPLRKTISSYLSLSRKINCDPNQIFIVGGSLQSLFLIGSLLLDKQDQVLLENPTFPNVHSVFTGLQAKILAFKIDQQGAKIPQKSKNFNNLKLLHFTPSCHYPLGVKMSLNRKHEAIKLANDTGAYIIENDYENEINNPNFTDQTIYGLDKSKKTFYLSTFNRILHPSIRVGYMIVPKNLVKAMKALMRHSHLFVSPSIQFMLNGFIQDNYLNKHLNQVQKTNIQRKEKFKKGLKNLNSIQFKMMEFKVPSLHTTINFSKGISDSDIILKLNQKGIIGHALSKCYFTNTKRQGVIFGHASLRTQQMTNKLDILSETLNSAIK